MNFFKPIKISRKTKQEVRYHPNMGSLSTRVTRIYKTIFGFHLKTLHEYRKTYHGKVKSTADCNLAKI
ncbi:MAG: hypothetical protein Q4G27_06070 [Flavobacteriaceae bacterium]|nr:hypothetical protein [Flavobacteriaceae bacterium]